MTETNINEITPKPIIILIASSTPEKPRDFEVVSSRKKLPIIFDDINKLLGSFHHSDEIEGSYVGNTHGKLDSLRGHIENFRDAENYVDVQKINGTTVYDGRRAEEAFRKKNPDANNEQIEKYVKRIENYKMRLTNYLKDRGLPPETKVYIAAEDGGFALPSEVWDAINKDGIPQSVLDKIKPDTKDPKFKGPGSETAPVISALLDERVFMKRIQLAIAGLDKTVSDKYKGGIPVLQNCAMQIIGINKGATDIEQGFEARVENHLHLPENISLNPEDAKISNYHYMKPQAYSRKNDEGKTIAELSERGIAEYSVRSNMAEKIYNELFAKEINAGYRPSYDHPHKKMISKEERFRIGAFGAHSNDVLFAEVKKLDDKYKLGDGFVIPKMGSALANQNGDIAGKSSYEILSDIEHIMAKADAFLLFPSSLGQNGTPKTAKEIDDIRFAHLVNLYTVASFEVSKQLNARDATKHLIILNHDGSNSNLVRTHNSLTNSGMTKDYSVSFPKMVKVGSKDIYIASNSYYDVIGTPKNGEKIKYDDTTAAAAELLREYRRGYNKRVPAKHREALETGIAPQKDVYNVAMFCSASNENYYLNEAVKNISYNISKKGDGVIYGGGDRYTMGAVLDGVMRRRNELRAGNGHAPLSEEEAKAQTYIAGYSTIQILKSETTQGKFSPHLNYTKQNENIYQRMADMLDNSNVIVAAPGGAGTVQEWTAALILNHYRPKEEQKPVIFFNPKLNKEQTQVWNVALRAVLGKDDYELLTNESTNKIIQEKREKRSKELGIYVETSGKKVVERISEMKQAHQEKENSKNNGHSNNQCLALPKSNSYVSLVGRTAPNVLPAP